MDNRFNKRLVFLLRSFFGRLSIQRRIALSILLCFVIILPSGLLSLLYFSSLLNGINIITEHDVKLGRMAADLALNMLDIRRDERNYRMFGNSEERESVENKIARAKYIIDEAGTIALPENQGIIDELESHLNMYSNSFNMLVEHISQNPPEEEMLKKIRKQISSNFRDFQTTYRMILTELDKASPAERDSILAKANEYLDTLTFDLLLNAATSPDQPNQPSYIQGNLDNSRQAFLDAANNLAEKSWTQMLVHKEESWKIEARAKRNIVSVLIVISVICILMVTYLPRYIVKPINSLNLIFRKAEKGDFGAQAHLHSNDEIGDLAFSYNQMMNRLRMYDDLKRRKINSQRRSIDRLLEKLDVPVCILNENLRAVYYNIFFINIFGSDLPSKVPNNGLDIVKLKEMNGFMEEIQKNITREKNDFVIYITASDGMVKTLNGRLVRDNDMNLESIIIVGVSDKTGKGDQ